MRRARARRGFTLIELMVALGMTGVVAVGLYSLSSVSAQTFQQQQRVSEMQLRLRSALDMIRFDVQRAGYLASPAAANRVDPRVCPDPAMQLQAVFASTPTVNPTWNTAANQFITPRELVLTGNYSTSDEYRVMGINGAIISLQHKSPTYAERIYNDAAAFARIFPANRILRVMGSNGQMQFTRVVSSSFRASTDAATTFPTVNVSPPITVIGGASSVAGSTNGCGIPGLGVGATVAPITAVRYSIENVQSIMPLAYGALDTPPSGATGAYKTDLIRRFVEPGNTARSFNNLANNAGVRIAAEYAVDFELGATFDERATPADLEPRITRYSFGADTLSRLDSVLVSTNFPQRVRSLVVRLSIRDRLEDPDFAWVARTDATQPLTRFRLATSATRPGAARVRTAVMEMELPNVSNRSLR